MKKALILVIAMALILSLGLSSALAAPENAEQRGGTNYVDANNDGVCDTCGATDANGDGVCDACPFNGVRPQDGTGRQAGRGGAGRGVGFVDANSDGVCDTCLRGGIRPQDGTGAQYGRKK